MTQINITKGDTHERDLTFTRNGVAIDITLSKIWFTIKRNKGDADPGILQVTSDGAEITKPSPLAGQARVKLSPAQTDLLTETVYDWDVQLRIGAAGTDITTTDAGTIIITGDVTRAIT